MMRMQLAGGSVKRLVEVKRDTQPARGEKPPTRIAVDSYGTFVPKTVSTAPHVNTPRWQQFLIKPGPDGDVLLAALKRGPVKVKPYGRAWVVDLDRIERT